MIMEIAIAHLGNMSQILPSTSVIRGIKKYDISTRITWVVNTRDMTYINKYNKDIYRTIDIDTFLSENKNYDLLINLYPDFPMDRHVNFKIRNAMGFCFYSHFDKFKKVFLENKKIFDMNLFQLYFTLIGMTWKGEGYDIKYTPKNKAKANRIGVSVANANIRNYILDNLKFDKKKMWYIPYKKNIFKRMDEINRCKRIITDDLVTFHLAMSMRKYVYYLETFPLSTKLELFGKGEICKVPMNII